ncbi:MAG: transglutaminase domain-containing protein [Gracilibacteraceae bacterium]|nr:transglutaminase domain-containing protein [Gracilibacteraceae bacterium]
MREKFGDICIPLLFSAALVMLTLGIYTRWAFLFVPPALVCNYLVFCLCARIKQNRAAGPVLIYLAAGALLTSPFYLVSRWGDDNVSVITALTQLKNGALPTPSLIALAAALCFFMASGVYYFTRVNVNMATTTLIITIPCMLYASRLTLIPPVYLAAVVALFIVVLIDCRRKESARDVEMINSRLYWLVIGGAVVLLVAAALILPKAADTPFDYFRMLYGNYDSLSRRSGDSLPDDAQNERPLLEVRAAEPLYLKRQTFGAFSLGGWNAVEEIFVLRGDWKKERSRLGVNNLLRLIKLAAQSDAGFAARYAAGGAPEAAPAPRTAEIRHLGLQSRYVPHPETSFEIAGLPADNLLQTTTGEILLRQSQLPRNAQYNLSYYSQIRDHDVMDYLSAFNYEDLLDDMDAAFARAGRLNARTEILAFETELEVAEAFLAATPYPAPERTAQLAALTTLGLRTDYEKAAALENYFRENSYIYDLNYLPPRGYEADIEYFIFNSRRGACSDFATAMTLMARAVGLNARYVEGFYAPPPDEGGLALVTGGSAHAYVEVFLPGYGWTVFEPTVAYEEARGAQSLLESGGERKWALLFAGCLSIAALLAFFVRCRLIPARQEAGFRRRVREAGAREGLILLYRRVQELLSRHRAAPVAPYTPRMLADFAQLEYGADLRPLTSLYERAAFAGAAVNESDLAEALETYELLRRVSAKRPLGIREK